MASHRLTSKWQRVERLFSPLSSPAQNLGGLEDQSPWWAFSIPNLQALLLQTVFDFHIDPCSRSHSYSGFHFFNKTIPRTMKALKIVQREVCGEKQEPWILQRPGQKDC